MDHGHFRRYFCCCILSRIAVLLLSSVSVLSSLGNAAAIFVHLRRVDIANGTAWNKLDPVSRGIFIAYGVFSLVFAVSALSGFIGAIVRSRGLVNIYVFVSWLILSLSTALGSLAIWAAFKHKNEYVQACIDHVNAGDADNCDASVKLVLGFVIAVFVVSVLIHLYLCIIIRRYKEQLDDEYQYEDSSFRAADYEKGNETSH